MQAYLETRVIREMDELIRTNDPVVLDVARNLLEADGIICFIADTHMSVLEGSIGVFQRRLLVSRDDMTAARRLMVDAGLGAELRDA
jgi:hypothetical protein